MPQIIPLTYTYNLILQLFMSLRNNRQTRHSIAFIAEKTSEDENHAKQTRNSIKKSNPPFILNNSQKLIKSDDPQNNSDTTTFKHKKNRKNKKKRGNNPQFSNHNFQKHTVVTVKKLGEQLTKAIGFSEAEQLAKRIWRLFLSSDINSKKILLILFGKANLKKESCKELFRECYLGEVCSCDELVVQQAQNILRKSFLSLVDDDLIRCHTKKTRNIYHKEEFIAYFMEFVQELRNGPFVKSRIDNQTKKKIERRVRAEKRLSKVQYKRNKAFVYQQLE